MRRVRYTGEALLARTVNDLNNRFQYPDLDTVGHPSQRGGGGGAPTVVVAAADSTDYSKNRADFQCPGVNDQQVIQTAVDALTVGVSSGSFVHGRVLICEGTYECTWPSDGTAAIQVPGSNAVTFEGMGVRNTILQVVGEAAVAEQDFFLMTYGHVRNMSIFNNNFTQTNANNGVHFAGGANCTAERLWVVNFQGSAFGTPGAGVGVLVDSDETHVVDCMLEECGYGVFVESRTNVFVGRNVIEDSDVGGVGGFGDHIQIVDNVIVEPDGPGVDVEVDESVIAGNVIRDSGGDGLVAESTNRTIITSNNVLRAGSATDDTFDGVRFTGVNNLVHGNRITPRASSGNQTRYGLNVASGNNNAVFANYLGDTSEYGTDDYVDSGTATIPTPDANGQFSY